MAQEADAERKAGEEGEETAVMAADVAWKVLNDDDEYVGIVFTANNAQAQRKGADRFCDGDYHACRVERCEWADEYAPGPVPFKVMFDHGWWTECTGCEVRIEEGGRDEGDVEIAFDIIETKLGVHCTKACYDRDMAQRAARKAMEDAAIERLSADLLAKRPGVTLTGKNHAYAGWDPNGELKIGQVWIGFRFPGCAIGDALYRIDGDGEPYATMCSGDVDAWKAYREKMISEGVWT